MRIAQVSPLYERVPPSFYGGTERVVYQLTEELVRAGHEVTLFASGDSQTSALLVPMSRTALRLGGYKEPIAPHITMVERVLDMQDGFDIIHSHIEFFGFPLARRARVPCINTLHGRQDNEGYEELHNEFRGIPLVSISDAQRRPQPQANWAATVYHGLDPAPFTFYGKPDDYVVYIGRVSDEKKADSAIRIAAMAGMKIKLAIKIGEEDSAYFEKNVKPLLSHGLVEVLGEITEARRNELVGRARAFIHAVDWPEPFGLAMIEAMACGTPVLGRKRGSIPEVIDHGVSGFVFETDEEAAELLRTGVPKLSRRRVREQFERRFLSGRMAQDYIRLYSSIIAKTGVPVHA